MSLPIRKAVELIKQYKIVSITFFEEMLHINYTEANKLIDALEESDFIDADNGCRQRQIHINVIDTYLANF